jgi:hypothetical protein
MHAPGPSVLIGAASIGQALGGYCGKTIQRWYNGHLLSPFVYKGAKGRNSPLRVKRDDLPKLRAILAEMEA